MPENAKLKNYKRLKIDQQNAFTTVSNVQQKYQKKFLVQ